MREIHTQAVYEAGLENPAGLDPQGYLVFVVQDFENYMEMEGWEGFFIAGRLSDYARLKVLSRDIGDDESLAVPGDWETYLRERKIPLTEEGISDLLQAEPELGGPSPKN